MCARHVVYSMNVTHVGNTEITIIKASVSTGRGLCRRKRYIHRSLLHTPVAKGEGALVILSISSFVRSPNTTETHLTLPVGGLLAHRIV